MNPLLLARLCLFAVMVLCAACSATHREQPVIFGSGITLRPISTTSAHVLCVDIETFAFREGEESPAQVTTQIYETLQFTLDGQVIELDYSGGVTGHYPQLSYCLTADDIDIGTHLLTAEAMTSAGAEHSELWAFEVQAGQQIVLIPDTAAAPEFTEPAS